MSEWVEDRLLPGFEVKTLEFPDDYDGRAVATLVRLPAASVLAFPGGLHDLVLSRREVRDAVFGALFAWAGRAAV
ncbi:MAG: hypothetical protein WD775_01030 [Burkholderiales bacterium]